MGKGGVRARARWTVAALVATAIVAGGLPACSSSGEDDGSRSKPTAWELELANTGSGGARSLESALRLFAIAFGPIPGVEAPERSGGFVDATTAVTEVRLHDAELTPEQRAAVEAALQPPADAVSYDIPAPRAETGDGGGGRARSFGPPAHADTYREAAELARTRIAARTGGDTIGQLTLIVGTPGGAALAYTQGRFGPDGGGLHGCDIVYAPGRIDNPGLLAGVMFHEMFHCFQNSTQPNQAAADAAYLANRWLWEGGATWAEASMVGPDVVTSGWWNVYLTDQEQSLLDKTYDGLGFFAHMEEVGLDPWPRFRQMYYAGANGLAAIAASGADSNHFLDSWGSGYVRQRRLGRAWDFDGAGITPASARERILTIGNDKEERLAAAPYASTVVHLVPKTDVLQIIVDGHGRIANGKIDRRLGNALFCTREEPCECPDGRKGPPRLEGAPAFALTAGAAPARALIFGNEFNDAACKKKKKARPKRPTGKGFGVVVTRPAFAQQELVIDELDVMEFAACNGIHGRWTGVLRTGGYRLAQSGVDAPVVEHAVEFTVDARGHAEVHTRLPAAIDLTVKSADLSVGVDLTITVRGRRMDIAGNYFADLKPTNLPIERAAKGRCR